MVLCRKSLWTMSFHQTSVYWRVLSVMFTTLRVLEPLHPCYGRCSAHLVSKDKCYLRPLLPYSLTLLVQITSPWVRNDMWPTNPLSTPLIIVIFQLKSWNQLFWLSCCLFRVFITALFVPICGGFRFLKDILLTCLVDQNNWYMEDGVYMPVCCLTLPGPRAIIELTKCGCKTECKGRCSFARKRLPCTPLCKRFSGDCGEEQSFSSDDLHF